MESDEFYASTEPNEFYSVNIYNYFLDELVNHENLTWNDFLNYKDLGLVYLGYSNYRIQDKKKWMLTKIKYGI